LAPTSHSHDLETTTEFRPRFDADGLMPAIVTDVGTKEVVMFAWMNREALDKTLASGIAHYWSRSRKELWQKGETSGNKQAVKEIRIDCDQDVLWLAIETAGDGLNCHTGARSCFYRRVTGSPASPTLVFDEVG
jgi:phosphoribosyl-AMP cyclohydrolase